MIPLPGPPPLLQIGGMSGQQIMDSLRENYITYGGMGFVLLAVLFFGRFILRSLVNKRVHGIQESSMGFMDLDSMYKKGLVTKEEYQAMRNRVAHRELERIKEADTGRETLTLLSTVAKNPALARVILEKDLAKSKGVPAEPPAAPGLPAASAEPKRENAAPNQPGVDPEAVRRMMEKDWIMPGDPLSDPRLARKAEPRPMAPPASARGRAKKPMDIEDLLARGLISKEEYDRLAGLFEQDE